MTGENDDLEFDGERAQDVEYPFLSYRIRVNQDVVEDEHLRFGGGEFLGDGDAEAEEELFFRSL